MTAVEALNKSDISKLFLMPISHVNYIPGRGTAVTGCVKSGVAKIGDELEIFGINPTQRVTVAGIVLLDEMNLVSECHTGTNCSILLHAHNLPKLNHEKMTLAKPDSIEIFPHDEIFAPKLEVPPNFDALIAAFHGVYLMRQDNGNFIGLNHISKQYIEITNLSKLDQKEINLWKKMQIGETSKYVRVAGENINPFYEYGSFSEEESSSQNGTLLIIGISLIILVIFMMWK